ncbi:MAG: glycogen synthase GlgA [Gammaproteobacteria bacterium]
MSEKEAIGGGETSVEKKSAVTPGEIKSEDAAVGAASHSVPSATNKAGDVKPAETAEKKQDANGVKQEERKAVPPENSPAPAAKKTALVQPPEIKMEKAPSRMESEEKTRREVEESKAAAQKNEGRYEDIGGESKIEFFAEPNTPFSPARQKIREVESLIPPIPEEIAASEAESFPYEVDEEPVQHEQHSGPQYPSMFIVQITPELAPLAKVGGLADVVTGLSRELELRGNSVEIILPKYDCMRYDQIWGLCKTFDDLWVPWYGGHIHCTVWFGFVHGRKCFFIEPHSQDRFFERGSIYGYDDDILRFAFFSRAAVEFMLKSGKHPDIIHCHDWQTALVPVYLYEIYQNLGMTHPRVCFTIHNFKHQGVTGDFLLNASGLHRPEYFFHYDRLLDNHTPHALNLMKGGIVYSNFVTTVSPRYAGETKDGGQGFGLEPTLHTHHYKYGGVVNGIDYDTWNPEVDTHIPVNYGVNCIDDKYANKRALRERLLLADNDKPIIAFIGRLDPQKGLDLVRHALFYSLNNNAQFVLLGSSPESSINNYFWELKRHLNDCPDCHIEVGFNEDLAHLIYSGADMIIVPSLFEPCGLTQLIAMRYGTIPVVRAVGGLADTVFDKDFAHDKPLHERNGYVFKDYDNPGLESALSRAIGCYYQYPEHFRELIKNAMNSDYSWKNPGQHYLNIYDYIRDK